MLPKHKNCNVSKLKKCLLNDMCSYDVSSQSCARQSFLQVLMGAHCCARNCTKLHTIHTGITYISITMHQHLYLLLPTQIPSHCNWALHLNFAEKLRWTKRIITQFSSRKKDVFRCHSIFLITVNPMNLYEYDTLRPGLQYQVWNIWYVLFNMRIS